MIIDTEQPKYRRLADMLRSQIKLGELKTGDRLPSFAEMYREHGATKTTLRRVYELLEKDNLIERRSGSGVYVAEPDRMRKTGKLGLLFRVGESYKHPYMMELLSSVRRVAKLQGLEIVLLDEETETVEPGQADALLIACDEMEALLMKLPPDLPHVLLFQHSPDFTCVAPDDFGGGKIATRHLLELGHRRILCLPCSNSNSIALLRLAGYKAAHKDAGIAVGEELVHFLHKPPGGYRVEGEETMRFLLEDGWDKMKCTAILAQNDEVAIGVLKALADAGIRVPEEVSVVGFDGTEVSDLCTPHLTTVKVPLAEIGERAIKVLLEQMRDGVSKTEKIVLPVQLKLGESTAPVSNSKE
jgi:DNA-binding LacI/PurR family transcriptional regulator